MKRNDEKLNEKLIGKYKHVAFPFSLLHMVNEVVVLQHLIDVVLCFRRKVLKYPTTYQEYLQMSIWIASLLYLQMTNPTYMWMYSNLLVNIPTSNHHLRLKPRKYTVVFVIKNSQPRPTLKDTFGDTMVPCWNVQSAVSSLIQNII